MHPPVALALLVAAGSLVACDEGTNTKTPVDPKPSDPSTETDPSNESGASDRKDEPECGPGEELQPSSARFDCDKDADCANSCKYGAINDRWYRVLGSGCRGGCEGRFAGNPKCIEGRCVAFTEDGERDEGCTDLPAPDEPACVPATEGQ